MATICCLSRLTDQRFDLHRWPHTFSSSKKTSKAARATWNTSLMATGSPPPPTTTGKPKRTARQVDVGLATIVAACILAGGGVAGVFIGRATAPSNTATSTTPKATPGKSTSSPASVTITPPVSGNIPFESTLSGQIVNLQSGQLVWTFFRNVSSDGSLASQVYPIAGPCVVNFTDQTWTCAKAYIGKQKDDHGAYRVCAAILNFQESFEVVQLIENTYANVNPISSSTANPSANLPDWFASPPSYLHDSPSSCMTVRRID
jgi:hypothetical protein